MDAVTLPGPDGHAIVIPVDGPNQAGFLDRLRHLIDGAVVPPSGVFGAAPAFAVQGGTAAIDAQAGAAAPDPLVVVRLTSDRLPPMRFVAAGAETPPGAGVADATAAQVASDGNVTLVGGARAAGIGLTDSAHAGRPAAEPVAASLVSSGPNAGAAEISAFSAGVATIVLADQTTITFLPDRTGHAPFSI